MGDQQSTEDRDRRRRLLLVILAALALLAVILVLILTQGDGDDGAQVAQTDTPSTPTVAPTVAETPSAPSVSEGSGPIAQWKFDGDALDVTGNGHDADALGGVEYVGGAADLDGIDDAFGVANADALNPKDAITVAAWWNAVDFVGVGNNGLVDKGFTSHTAPHYQYHLWVTGTGYTPGGQFGFSVALDGASVGTGGIEWTAGQLYHLVGTYDGSEVDLYVNGALEASRAASGSMTDYGQDLFIGTFTNLHDQQAQYLPGAIDEVTIWDRALSADEIAELHSAGPQ